MAGALLAAGYTALFLYLIRRWRGLQAPGLSSLTIGGIFLLKILAGTALWAVYTYVYPDRSTADIFKYFDDGRLMFSALPGSPSDYLRMLFGIGNDTPHFDSVYYLRMNNWYRAFETGYYNDAHTMIRYNAALHLFSFGHYPVHTVIVCLFSTLGSVLSYKAFVHHFKGHEQELLIAIFLLPTVTFWSSGVLKENLLMIGLGAVLWGGMTSPGTRRTAGQLAAFLFGVALLSLVKSYVILCMMPGLISWWWASRTTGGVVWRFGVVHAVVFGVALAMGHGIPGPNVLELLATQQRDFIGMVREVSAGSLIELPVIEPELGSLLRNAPHALFVTYLAPIIGWSFGPMALAAAVENLALLILMAVLLSRTHRYRRPDLPLLMFFVSFLLLLGLLIGWTTPVLGAVVRYRMPLLPFLIMSCLLFMEPRRKDLDLA
jgi:hypothetical protein